MTIEKIEKVICDFLKRKEEPEVLVLKGTWGCGKTFFWNSIVKKQKKSVECYSGYSYVSLFGVSSISDLRTAIFINSLLDSNNPQNILKDTTNILEKFTKVPFLKDIFKPLVGTTLALESIAPSLIKETLICLDDFERMSSSIKTDELLGLISELKERKKCKIVLIFNEEKLSINDKKKDYEKYREKVVDIELLFKLTPEESAKIAFSKNLLYCEYLQKCTVLLNITNIRILKKIATLYKLVCEEKLVKIDNIHQGVIEKTIISLVLYTHCFYGCDGDKLDKEFIKKWNNYRFGLVYKDLNHKDKKFVDIFRQSGIGETSEYDLKIFDVVECGYLDENFFLEEANSLSQWFIEEELKKSFEDAWALFHNTFSDNKADLIQEIIKASKNASSYLSLLDLDGSIDLLRKLKHDNEANELINHYIENHSNNPQKFNVLDDSFSGYMRDSIFKKRLEEESRKHLPDISLSEAINHMIANKDKSDQYVYIFKRAKENDFYNLFKQEDSNRDLSEVVKLCLDFLKSNDSECQEIGQKACAALYRIGKENGLNRIRVSRFGITIEDDEPFYSFGRRVLPENI